MPHRRLFPILFALPLLFVVLAAAAPAFAHFGMVIPDRTTFDNDHRTTTVQLIFAHPFEGQGMDLAKPQAFVVYGPSGEQDLTGALKPVQIMDHGAWQAEVKAVRPGVYALAMTPQPYWEPAEDVSIIHYTKVLLPAYGDEEGWDEPMGLPVEIVPLTRPFGNYAGTVFTGQVLKDGKPLPNPEVEVEYYNQDGSLTAPTEYHVTMVVKGDDQGIFTVGCPRAGWWGFAALTEGDAQINDPSGQPKGVELGGVLWTYFDDWQQK